MLGEQVGWIIEDGGGAASIAIRIDEGCAFDAVVAYPIEREGRVALFDVERFGIAIVGEAERQVIVAVDDPGIAGFTGKQCELTDGVALWRACGLVVSHNDPATDYRFALARQNSDIHIGVTSGEKIIGSAMVGHDGHRGWLYYVAVAPDHRSKGIGGRGKQVKVG